MRAIDHSSRSRRLAIIVGLLCVLTPASLAQDGDDTVIRAAEPDSALGLTVEQAYGETLRYDFGVVASGRHFHLDVTFRPGEVYWHELWEGGITETDPTQAVLLDEHRLLASWPEENGWFIVLYADFLTGATSFCATLGLGEDRQSSCTSGTITRVR